MAAVSSSSTAALRQLLAERFPSSRPHSARVLTTGLTALDEVTGGIPLGAITEVVCAAPSCGGHLLFARLLAVTRAARNRVALIDSSDSFDPTSYPEDALPHLLWVRAHHVEEALQAADLLTRDANLGLVLLDLRSESETALRRIPAAQWYRLQRAVEPSGLALVVETPRPTVASALLRIELNRSHPLSALGVEQRVLSGLLSPAVQRQRIQFSTQASR